MREMKKNRPPFCKTVAYDLVCEEMTSKLTGRKMDKAAVVISGDRKRILGAPAGRRYVACVDYEGEVYTIDYRKLWTRPVAKCEIFETEEEIVWQIRLGSEQAMMLVNIRCDKTDMCYTEQKGLRDFNGSAGYGTLKLYRREGDYCTLIDHLELTNVICGFGVKEQ